MRLALVFCASLFPTRLMSVTDSSSATATPSTLHILLTFSLFPDSEGHLAAFNAAFHSAAEALTRYLGHRAQLASVGCCFARGRMRTEVVNARGGVHSCSGRVRHPGWHGCHTLDAAGRHSTGEDGDLMTHRIGGGISPPPPTPPDMWVRVRRFLAVLTDRAATLSLPR